jgi:hypothetical protein
MRHGGQAHALLIDPTNRRLLRPESIRSRAVHLADAAGRQDAPAEHDADANALRRGIACHGHRRVQIGRAVAARNGGRALRAGEQHRCLACVKQVGKKGHFLHRIGAMRDDDGQSAGIQRSPHGPYDPHRVGKLHILAQPSVGALLRYVHLREWHQHVAQMSRSDPSNEDTGLIGHGGDRTAGIDQYEAGHRSSFPSIIV